MILRLSWKLINTISESLWNSNRKNIQVPVSCLLGTSLLTSVRNSIPNIVEELIDNFRFSISLNTRLIKVSKRQKNLIIKELIK